MAQRKQVHQASGCVRFIDESGSVIGWEGRIPTDENAAWEDAGVFDPYAYLAEISNKAQRDKTKNNPKQNKAAENLYYKLLDRGYSEQEASASTGYTPEEI